MVIWKGSVAYKAKIDFYWMNYVQRSFYISFSLHKSYYEKVWQKIHKHRLIEEKKRHSWKLAFIGLFVSAQMRQSKSLCSFFPL